MEESLTEWVATGENPAVFFTKFLYGSKRRHIVGNVMRYILNEQYQLNSRPGRPCCTFHSGT